MQAVEENGKVMEGITNAFHSNWNLHPYPDMLIRKDRTILAVNRAGESLDIPADVKSFKLANNDRICPGCQADES